MSNRKAYTYVNGTTALEIPRVKTQESPKIIRVDFKGGTARRDRNTAREQRILMQEKSSAHLVRPHDAAHEAASGFAERAEVRSDVRIVLDALGFKEMYDEFRQGSLAGQAVRFVPAPYMAACCISLFLFCVSLFSF